MQYVEPIISGILLIAYIFIAIKQGKYIAILKETNEQIKGITTIQSGLISDFKTHRELFNMDDIAKLVQLKLDNQQLALAKEYADKEQTVVQEYLDKLNYEQKKTSELSVRASIYEATSTEMRYKLEELKGENIRANEQLKNEQAKFHMMDQTALHILTVLEKQAEHREAGRDGVVKDPSTPK
jgi:hypothetical protein